MKLGLVLIFLFYSMGFGFNIPILTLNHEVGSRYAIETFEEDDLAYIAYDGYTFNKGYAQINETISRVLAFKFKFYYNLKNYDTTTNWNNKTFYYYPYFSWTLIKGMKLNLGFKWNTKNYVFGNSKNFEALLPGAEIRYNPIKYLHLGLKYSFISADYIHGDGDYTGNRGSIWYEQRLIPQINLRVRYRIENRDYKIETSQRQDSFKHSFAATMKIDLNK